MIAPGVPCQHFQVALEGVLRGLDHHELGIQSQDEAGSGGFLARGGHIQGHKLEGVVRL
jgi:hypothetical protein